MVLLDEGIARSIDEGEAKILAGASHGRGEVAGQQDGIGKLLAEFMGKLEEAGRAVDDGDHDAQAGAWLWAALDLDRKDPGIGTGG